MDKKHKLLIDKFLLDIISYLLCHALLLIVNLTVCHLLFQRILELKDDEVFSVLS